MAHARTPLKFFQNISMKDFTYKPCILVPRDIPLGAAGVAYRYTTGFLSPMLQSAQPPGNIGGCGAAIGMIDTEYTAFFFGFIKFFTSIIHRFCATFPFLCSDGE